jgi:hypothetical protein
MGPRQVRGLDLVERFFRDLGAFKSVPDPIAAISDYINGHNGSPRPFAWEAKAETIIEKVRRDLNKTRTA